MAKSFELGREVAADGRFVRQESAFRRWVTSDGSSGVPGRGRPLPPLRLPRLPVVAPCRYRAPPEGPGGGDLASPTPIPTATSAAGRSAAAGSATRSTASPFSSEAYTATDPGFDGRVTVPVLWDKRTGQIVSNESGDILRMLNGAFDAWAKESVDLYPQALRAEIDALNQLVYDNVNNGVYKAGFARSQKAYEDAYERLFATLDELEQRLATSRFLVGDAPTEADWRLFPTLVRFDAVYYSHFKCNRAGSSTTRTCGPTRATSTSSRASPRPCAMDQIKRHYYTTHEFLNPSRIIPVGPEIDFLQPHERAG